MNETQSEGGHVTGELVELNDNAGWCWFEGERAIVLPDGRILAGTVADGSGAGGDTRNGNIELTTYDPRAGTSSVFILHEHLEDDDHDSPAIFVRHDGRILAVYGRHGGDRLQCWRITTRPGDTSEWAPEQTLDVGAGYTYSNLFRLSAEGDRLYNFHRGVGFNPNYTISDDDGTTWRYGGRLLTWTPEDAKSTLGGSGRPYLRYASNGTDAVHFITTEDHPRNYDNSLYHGVFRGGRLHHTDGTPIESDGPPSPTALTRIFQGDPNNVAWTTDIRLDGAGRPHVLFSVQKGDAALKDEGRTGGQDLRYHHARWDGRSWHTREIARAGSRLYEPEVDYSGLAVIDPRDVNTVYISTNADPVSGGPLISRADGQRHYEIFRGRTRDDGATWMWTAITRDSGCDNLRPVVPAGAGDTSPLLWLRGTYRTYRDYGTRLVCLAPPRAE